MTKLVLLTKRDWWSRQAAAIARSLLGGNLTVYEGRTDDPFPTLVSQDAVQILSFLSPWIVPGAVLERTSIALNFHPGSREYPGTGCYNFALYEETNRYGCVCHHMATSVDTGGVLFERLFDVSAGETVESLKLRTMVAMLDMFHDVVGRLAFGSALPSVTMAWSRKPFKRVQLEALREILPSMTREEVARRVRATTYPGYPGPYVRVHGFEFTYSAPQREPVA